MQIRKALVLIQRTVYKCDKFQSGLDIFFEKLALLFHFPSVFAWPSGVLYVVAHKKCLYKYGSKMDSLIVNKVQCLPSKSKWVSYFILHRYFRWWQWATDQILEWLLGKYIGVPKYIRASQTKKKSCSNFATYWNYSRM